MQALKPFIDVFVNDLLIPIILIIIPVVVARVDGYFKRLAKSTEDKNNQDALLSVGNLLTETLRQIEQIVSGAVAANMSLAEKFKEEAGGKLSDDMINELKETAFEVSYALLPNNITDGPIFEVLGGKEGIRKLMYNFIDKQVILLKEPKKVETGYLIGIDESALEPVKEVEPQGEQIVEEASETTEDVDPDPISGNVTINKY